MTLVCVGLKGVAGHNCNRNTNWWLGGEIGKKELLEQWQAFCDGVRVHILVALMQTSGSNSLERMV